MENQDRFKVISPRVINELDGVLPDWQSKVRPGLAGTLNEETLIQYLKEEIQYETKKRINDKRVSLFIESLDYSEKGLDYLSEEFSSFAHEEIQKWFRLDQQMDRIIAEFRSRLAPVDIENLNQSLDLVAAKMGERVDGLINRINGDVDVHLSSLLGRTMGREAIVISEELKSFLRGKVEKIKEENKRIGDRQKDFINNSVNKLIQSKVDKIKSGQLSADYLNRSDLFTDEEINALREAQKKVVFDTVRERYRSNMDMINEATHKFMGVSGREGVIQKLSDVKAQLEGKESAIFDKIIKEVVPDVFGSGGILPGDYNPESRRIKRFTPSDGACLLLDYAAFILNTLAGDQPTGDGDELKDDILYQECKNPRPNLLNHVFLSPVDQYFCP